ncbi:MarR family winged helix-turn-helix transcriptional regulator [Antrihabitans sp. YC2-6]|uniref:MarR family winged helix-turn-helix transcriptional regulator n=1 Tax=Antrihabitans sp. YC2-6 TaxID=2799498 RepID=UPI0018F57117|nr:MarR family winged helix-turn-helix transcriptional regulator [Antrihabitans sp. YC2-6]MBJ8345140.1 winged helix-turn-helix transcriptional regulator [Antrihabitans sp. YC2-6]
MAAVSEQIGLFFATQHDLRPNDFRALVHIMVADVEGRPLTAGELARLLGTSAAAMTYLVERMIESGHIRRESDAADRRKVILRYAEHGMEVARGFFGPLGVRTRGALADFPDADLETAHRVFGALIESMRLHNDDLGGN